MTTRYQMKEMPDLQGTGEPITYPKMVMTGPVSYTHLDAACRCKVNLLCREYQRSVTGVYTGKLYVLGDGVFHHLSLIHILMITLSPQST